MNRELRDRLLVAMYKAQYGSFDIASLFDVNERDIIIFIEGEGLEKQIVGWLDELQTD